MASPYLCQRQLSLLLKSLPARPSPIHNAILRRHLTTLVSQSRRPSASFMYQNNMHDRSFSASLTRFMRNQYSPARKNQMKARAYHWTRSIAQYLVFAVMSALLYEGFVQVEREHEHPTPPELSLWTRWVSRATLASMAEYEKQGWATDGEWASAGQDALQLLKELEKDGKVKEQSEDGAMFFVDTVGKLGYDVSEKSESWKQNYWDLAMSVAKCAEHIDGLCKRKGADMKRDRLYKWENIPGPQNPRPVPPEWDRKGAHLKVPAFHEVEPALEAPETYYLKLLTTKGFSNRQRLDAALACADWMDYKGLKDTAASMYDWAVDIAAGGLPEGANHVVDIQTGVINAGKENFVSDNLFKASTALAVWHARHGEVKEALPIFLSLLKARKMLPPAPPDQQIRASGRSKAPKPQQPRSSGQIVLDSLSSWWDFLDTATDRVRVKSTGDERPTHSLKQACEEAGLMAYIGEILFATSEKEREKGLSWTRDSVDAAEAILWFMDEQDEGNQPDLKEGRKRCTECLDTGLNNWQAMTAQLVRSAREREAAASRSSWSFFGSGNHAAEVQKWVEEVSAVDLRRKKVSTLVDPLRR